MSDEVITFNGERVDYPNCDLYEMSTILSECEDYEQFKRILVQQFGCTRREASIMLLAIVIGEDNFTDLDVVLWLVEEANELRLHRVDLEDVITADGMDV